ncbi:MAG: NAD(+) synthase [Acidobacteria bacterium]|nr:NAD(+) synthase [Acidobacteriota bacterium]
MRRPPFESIYRHAFVRVAVCIPLVRLGNPGENATRTIALARRAHEAHAAIAVFPELGLSAYSNEDLFHQEALLDAARDALAQVVEASRPLDPLLLVGVPLRLEQKLFNCAAAVHGGRLLGVTPKTYLPNYREFYERRQFTPGTHARSREVTLLGATAPFGNDLVYELASIPDCAVHVEICEDLWVPAPPSTYAALAGATILTNLSASNVTIGKSEYRRMLCASHSGRCIAAYAYAAAGSGESTTDLAWDGHGMIYENGQRLAETERFAPGEQLIVADIDLERLVQERVRMTSFNDAVLEAQGRLPPMRRVPVAFEVPDGPVALTRHVERFPYVPSDPAARDERCREAYSIQVQGLAARLASTGIARAVIGVSGGLDSAHALIVTARAMDRLELPRANVLGFSMPGFATSERTRTNALALMRALGVTAGEIDIRPSCLQMLKDLGHPYAAGQAVYDVTFENVQAGERTSHLFRLANQHGGLVVGTSDLSELALGWCTYGVGDQMAHYSVNASVPKTLIAHLIRWAIRTRQFDDATSTVLQSIADTEISPELVPGQGAAGPSQASEAVLGPFALQDFFLYYVSRFGYRPSRVAFLAEHAWGDRASGAWPDDLAEADRREYTRATIKRWLAVFLRRFFETSQFKRSALPNAPKVGSGGSLSPRSDWRAPSDGHADAWIEELERDIPD